MASIPLLSSSFLFLLLLCLSSFPYSHSQSDHVDFTQSLALTPPLPTSTLPTPSPECTLSLLNYTYNSTATSHSPITVLYYPPSNCSGPWTNIVLHLSGAVSGNFSAHIASVFLNGAEIIRTSTPEPYNNGTAWDVSKDITKYSVLLNGSQVPLSVGFQNVVDGGFGGVYDGVFEFNLTLLYYKDNAVVGLGRKLGVGSGLRGLEGDGFYDQPADVVIPVGSDGDDINWFKIDKVLNVSSKNVTVPSNARKVVLELYVSAHGDDEFWYSNPPDSYILGNNLTSARGGGAYREVFVRIDGELVGSEVPFPVVYTGGINPLFWRPVVGIGAFDLPTYDFDLTPYLGLVLDGSSHSFEIGVSNAIDYWLMDANLHVWLDKAGDVVQAGVGVVQPAETKQKFEYEFKHLDGKFEIEVERKSQSLGWVASSLGNFTTSIEKELKFKSKIKYKNNGGLKTIKQKIKVKMAVTVSDAMGSTISQSSFKRKYPLTLTISTMPGPDIDTNLMITNISQSLDYEFSNEKSSGLIQNIQDAGGWVVLQNESVLSGVADTQQNLSYRGASGCVTRAVQASGGKLIRDESINTCNSLLQKVFNVVAGNLVGQALAL